MCPKQPIYQPPPFLPACRVELVDEPADVVAPLLEGYREALQAAAEAAGSSSTSSASLWDSAAASGDGEGRQQAQVRGRAGLWVLPAVRVGALQRIQRHVGLGCRAGLTLPCRWCCFPVAQQLWRWMQTLPDANGRSHGVGLGSLETRAERSSMGMKPTAASLR